MTAAVTSFLVGRWSALVGVGRRKTAIPWPGLSLCPSTAPPERGTLFCNELPRPLHQSGDQQTPRLHRPGPYWSTTE